MKPAVKYGESCPFCGHEGRVLQSADGMWFVECQNCEVHTGLYDTAYEATAAWNNRTCSVWVCHDESSTWECPECHACFDLDNGSPKDKYLNYCPVCGTKLELPE